MFQLKCNKCTEFPSQHIAVAVSETLTEETNNRVCVYSRLDCGAAVAWRMSPSGPSRVRRLQFNDKGMFWDWLRVQLHPKLGTWLWADDLQRVLWLLGVGEELDSGRLKYNGWILSGNVSFCKCETEHGNIIMLDRCNWWRCPIDQFMYAMIPYIELDSLCRAFDGKGRGRLIHICEAIRQGVTQLCQFVRTNDLGVMKITAAGQALASYRHKFGPRRHWTHTPRSGKNKGKEVKESRVWPYRHDCKPATDLERAAYYGGPTHCYYIGHIDTPVHVLDVRSIYPSVMLNHQYPVELLDRQESCGIEECRERLDYEGCIALVKLHSEHDVYPVKRKQDTIYVNGTFQTSLAGPELTHALQQGHVEKIYQCNWYRMMDIFSPFVNEMYSLRKKYESESNPVWADLCKLILNSLGSKFGQMTGEWRDMPDIACESPWGYWHICSADTEENLICRGISNNTQVKAAKKEAAHSFPAIPAYMCSYARVKMNRLIGIGRLGGQVWYSAVDSIHCDTKARFQLERDGCLGTGLGELRDKGIFQNADYYGIGHYELDGRLTQSGLPANSHPACQRCKTVIMSELKECPKCEKFWDGHTWTWLERDCAAAAINRGPAAEVVDTNVIVSLPRTYKFGKIGLDGWVTPYYIDYSQGDVALTLESLTEQVPF